MGGTSGEADGSEEVDILAVCLNSYRGGGTKNGCILRTVGLINTKFGYSIPEGMPYHYVVSILQQGNHGVHMGAWNSSSMLLWLKKHQKQGKIQPGVCRSTPRVFLSVSWMSSVQYCITVIQYFLPLCEKQCSKEAKVLYSTLPRWCLMLLLLWKDDSRLILEHSIY